MREFAKPNKSRGLRGYRYSTPFMKCAKSYSDRLIQSMDFGFQILFAMSLAVDDFIIGMMNIPRLGTICSSVMDSGASNFPFSDKRRPLRHFSRIFSKFCRESEGWINWKLSLPLTPSAPQLLLTPAALAALELSSSPRS